MESAEHNENKNITIHQLVQILVRWKKVVSTTILLTALLAVIFSSPYFIPPEYKSEVVFYPPNHSTKMMIDHDLYFGVDKEIDESIQILKSSILRDSIINKYQLMLHYEIDPARRHHLNDLHKKFNENIKIERTRYNSISIIVYDTDPVIAAQIASDMVKIGDYVKYSIIKENLKHIYYGIERESLKQLKTLDTLSEEIRKLDSHLFSSKELNLAQTNQLDVLKTQMDIRNMIATTADKKEYVVLNLLYEYESKFNQYVEISNNLKDLNRKLNIENVDSYVITPAEVADKKSYPIRWLIVVIALAGSFMITTLFLLLIEKEQAVSTK